MLYFPNLLTIKFLHNSQYFNIKYIGVFITYVLVFFFVKPRDKYFKKFNLFQSDVQ